MRLRGRIDFKEIIKSWFTTHPWLKLIALVLAVLVWLYIGEELRRFLL